MHNKTNTARWPGNINVKFGLPTLGLASMRKQTAQIRQILYSARSQEKQCCGATHALLC